MITLGEVGVELVETVRVTVGARGTRARSEKTPVSGVALDHGGATAHKRGSYVQLERGAT